MSVASMSRIVSEIPRVACIKEEATPTPPKIRALRQAMKTRPVPILAETTAILAGTSPIGWLRMTLACALGSAVPAILYAWAGSTAREPAEGTIVFLIVLAFSGVVWLIGRRKASRSDTSARTSP